MVDYYGHSGALGSVCYKFIPREYVNPNSISCCLTWLPVDFFIAATITPMTADLAAAARELEGIGCENQLSS
jgi:hypothetical protein